MPSIELTARDTNCFVRPNRLPHPGALTRGHTHEFDHLSIFWSGWFLVRAVLQDGRRVVRQFASRGYQERRALAEGIDGLRRFVATSPDDLQGLRDRVVEFLEHAPPAPSVPVVLADGTVSVLASGAPIPEGAEPIDCNPVAAHALIRREVVHEIVALDQDTGSSEYWCMYAHRTPQGTVTQEATGWEEGYT